MTTRSLPVYQRIADELRRQITRGEPLPSVSHLARWYDCTRPTVQKAINLLQREGLIGADRKAVERSPIEIRMSDTESLSFSEDMARAGHVAEPPDIQVRIEGDRVVRYVLRAVDGEPHNWARWAFPLERVQGTRLAYDTDIPDGSVRFVKEGLGWNLKVEKFYDVRPATPQEAAILRPPPGWNVIAEHWTGTLDGETVIDGLRILRADRTRLVP